MIDYPTQLDEIDQWLADNFGILPGACSSTENLRYNTARMIAEALWPKCKDTSQDATRSEKELTEAAEAYASNYPAYDDEQVIAKYAFKRGAEWQKEQFEKNRLAACDAMTKEEYELEMDFSTNIVEKEHRLPTYIDAIKYGMQKQKEQDNVK